MIQIILKSVALLITLVVIVCGIYPISVWLIGQSLFPFQANGSLILNSEGKAIGSKLIAQAFTQDEYFHPRPSAANYDAPASRSSSLAASNPILRDRVTKSLESIMKKTGLAHPQEVPGDWVTTSASGLDPHITLKTAEFQLDRIVNKWSQHLKRNPEGIREEIQAILLQKAEAPFAGLLGEKLINVLEVNIELEKKYKTPKQ